MTDDQFMSFLKGYAYVVQRGGYGSGPVPDSFWPVFPFYKNANGTIARERTLESPVFAGITAAGRQKLLAAGG